MDARIVLPAFAVGAAVGSFVIAGSVGVVVGGTGIAGIEAGRSGLQSEVVVGRIGEERIFGGVAGPRGDVNTPITMIVVIVGVVVTGQGVSGIIQV